MQIIVLSCFLLLVIFLAKGMEVPTWVWKGGGSSLPKFPVRVLLPVPHLSLSHTLSPSFFFLAALLHSMLSILIFLRKMSYTLRRGLTSDFPVDKSYVVFCPYKSFLRL